MLGLLCAEHCINNLDIIHSSYEDLTSDACESHSMNSVSQTTLAKGPQALWICKLMPSSEWRIINTGALACERQTFGFLQCNNSPLARI